jgi:hypothetical protein
MKDAERSLPIGRPSLNPTKTFSEISLDRTFLIAP